MGGVAVYLNGNRVARFNLEEGYNAFTEPIPVHNAILQVPHHSLCGSYCGGNERIAFEIHGSSYSDSIDFCLTSVLVLLLYQLSR